MRRERRLAGLNVGNSSICAVIGGLDAGNRLEVLGIGCVPSQGIQRGTITDAAALTGALEEVVSRAEESANLRLDTVFVGFSPVEMKNCYRRGTVNLSGQEKNVVHKDMERAERLARRVFLSLEETVLAEIQQEWCLDDQEGIRSPLGMAGTRLTAQFLHLVVPAAVRDKLEAAVDQIGLEAEGIYPSGPGAGFAVLTEEERNGGVVLLDIGGGTTQIVLFDEGRVTDVQVMPWGGNNLTEKIGASLSVDAARAEELKLKYARVRSRARKKEIVPAGGEETRRPARWIELDKVAEAETRKMFSRVKTALEHSPAQPQPVSALVLTGGGSQLEGISELAGEFFDLPARVGVAQRVKGSDDLIQSQPAVAAAGLIYYGARQARKKNLIQGLIPVGAVRCFQDLMDEYF